MVSLSSRVYFALLTIKSAHPTDIFSLAATPTQLISGSGSSSVKIYSTTEAEFPLRQVLENVHRLGCHHVAVSGNGVRLASVGFEGDTRIWDFVDGSWIDGGSITGTFFLRLDVYVVSCLYCSLL